MGNRSAGGLTSLGLTRFGLESLGLGSFRLDHWNGIDTAAEEAPALVPALQSLTATPILRAVPAMMRLAASW